MNRWYLLERALAPGNGEELRLYKRGEEFAIRVGKGELMNSRMHGSEEALAELACRRVTGRPRPRVLIGGLGMGFTLAKALHVLGAEAQLVVAELVPAVVVWNRGLLGGLAGNPLQDSRVTVREVDVATIMLAEKRAYDAILLDIDNGPDGLTRKGNDWLYGLNGLKVAHSALRTGGVLTVWSAAPDQQFSNRLQKAGFTVDEVRVRARGARGGARHTIWIAYRIA